MAQIALDNQVAATAGLPSLGESLIVVDSITKKLRTVDDTGKVTEYAGPYTTGDGGAVTQLTNKSTAVVLAKPTGQITMNNASLAAGAIISFTLTNTLIAATDLLVLNQVSGTLGAYTLNAQCNAGNATITIRNNTAASLGEAVIIRFALVKGSIT